MMESDFDYLRSMRSKVQFRYDGDITVTVCSDEDVIQIESSLLTEEIVYDDFTNALNTPNSEWWMTTDKTPVSIESFKKLADCDSMVDDYPMMDVDSFLNLTSGGEESNENEQITLIVDSDSSFSPNDESGFEDDNVLCEISQNRKDRIENKDTGSKRNNNKDSEEEDETIDGRKRRHRNPENWKVNIQKNARLRGLEYIGIGGRKVPARKMGPPCNCRLHCSIKVSEELRKQLHERFWKRHNWDERKQLIANCVRETTKNVRKYSPEGRRPIAYNYFLIAGNCYVTVCKIMFLSTFAITEKFVRCVLEKKKKSPQGIVGPDLRGKHHTTKKSEEVRQRIRDHIKSFPTVKSDDPSEPKDKRYLDSRHTISKMYKMYVEQCQWKKVPPKDIVKESYYREIFKNEFNYGFKDFTEGMELPEIPII